MRTQRACRFALHFTYTDSRIFIATVCIIYSNKILLYRFIHSLLKKEYSDFYFPAGTVGETFALISMISMRTCTVASVTSPFLVRGVARDGRRKGWRERNGLGAFLLHSVSEVGGS